MKNLAKVPKRPLRVESGRAIVDADGMHLCNLQIKGADTWAEALDPRMLIALCMRWSLHTMRARSSHTPTFDSNRRTEISFGC